MMSKLMSSGEWMGDLGKLGLRLGLAGTMLIAHGLPKIQAWNEKSAVFPDPMGLGSPTSMGLAIAAETFAAGLVVIGALTRLSLIPLIITMATAFFVIHGSDPWQQKELAFIYLVGFSALFFVGPGRLSVDSLLLKK